MLRVAIHDQVLFPAERAVEEVRDLAADLEHQFLVGRVVERDDLHAARGELDEEDDVVGDESARGRDVGREEVRRGDRLPVRLQERSPGRLSDPWIGSGLG